MIAVLSASVTIGACIVPANSRGAPVFSVMFITREPPPERVEVITVRPSEDMVWIKGHWSGHGNDYAWTKGHWARPESGMKEWENGRWEHQERGWFYTEGHWR